MTRRYPLSDSERLLRCLVTFALLSVLAYAAAVAWSMVMAMVGGGR